MRTEPQMYSQFLCSVEVISMLKVLIWKHHFIAADYLICSMEENLTSNNINMPELSFASRSTKLLNAVSTFLNMDKPAGVKKSESQEV